MRGLPQGCGCGESKGQMNLHGFPRLSHLQAEGRFSVWFHSLFQELIGLLKKWLLTIRQFLGGRHLVCSAEVLIQEIQTQNEIGGNRGPRKETLSGATAAGVDLLPSYTQPRFSFYFSVPPSSLLPSFLPPSLLPSFPATLSLFCSFSVSCSPSLLASFLLSFHI